jgi:hypothetical protein
VEGVLGALEVPQQTVQTLYFILLLLLAAAKLLAEVLGQLLRVVLAAGHQTVISLVVRGLRGKALLAATLLVKPAVEVVVGPLLLVLAQAIRVRMAVLVRLLLLLDLPLLVLVGAVVEVITVFLLVLVVLVVVLMVGSLLTAHQRLLTQVEVVVGVPNVTPMYLMAVVAVLVSLSFAMSFNNRRATSWHTTH